MAPTSIDLFQILGLYYYLTTMLLGTICGPHLAHFHPLLRNTRVDKTHTKNLTMVLRSVHQHRKVEKPAYLPSSALQVQPTNQHGGSFKLIPHSLLLPSHTSQQVSDGTLISLLPIKQVPKINMSLRVFRP